MTKFKYDYYRNTDGHEYKWYKYFKMSYQCKLLFWLRKVQMKPSLYNKYRYNKIKNKHGNEIFINATIGEGLYLGHLGPRYINGSSVIGKNCNINQNVTIGQENRGKRKGAPTIGDMVWIGANAVIVGKITIGNDVLIAPNAFVNFDVPDNSIVIGNPGKIIRKKDATADYINCLKYTK